MPSIDRPEPPYLQIARHIRDQILAGQLKDGDHIPSAREIMRSWRVASATATKALGTLRAEGLTQAVEGVGTVVRAQGTVHRSARDRSIAIGSTGRIYPPGHYAKIRRAGVEPAPMLVADALGVEEGMPVIRRQRTTYTAEDVPVSTSVSWFDGALATNAPLLLIPERIVQGTAKYAAEQSGRSMVTTYVQHAAGFASEEEAAELGITDGSAVLLSRNRFVDGEGAVIEYGESTALPGHWVFYEYSIEDSE
ncbi:MAG: GntR family transcriptional regulator [Kutzneria sp.]|nr:GntR family transcriptional regulator [Kutzneria sp.]